jgi:hypothetical protein
MPRRKTKHITGIKGSGVVDYAEVWRVFECYRPGCSQLMKISEDWMEEQKTKGNRIQISCPICGFINDESVIERTPRWKYCRVCEWLQPLENFHKHKAISRSFRSGRQLECKYCKNLKINPTLNPLRTSDQFKESAERRRLYGILAGESGKINSSEIFKKFEGKCFKCGKELKYVTKGQRDWTLDHTLPAKYLWPIATENATLLCNDCNNLKHEKWPSEFYGDEDLKKLSVLTSIQFELLKGPAQLNPKAVEEILANIDKFIQDWIHHPEEIRRIRDLILEMRKIDIYEKAKHVPDFLK